MEAKNLSSIQTFMFILLKKNIEVIIEVKSLFKNSLIWMASFCGTKQELY
jgi:hypothetical protein